MNSSAAAPSPPRTSQIEPELNRRSWLFTVFAACCYEPRPDVAAAAYAGAQAALRRDDTAALQAIIDAAVARGGVARFPSGTHLIDTAVSLRLQSGVNVELQDDTVLRALDASQPSGAILSGVDVSDVAIRGGRLIGNRLSREPRSAPRGMGIDLRGCRAVTVSGVAVSRCAGDAIYIAASRAVGSAVWKPSREITIEGCTLQENRRQGISLVGADGVTISRCQISGTGPARPGAGIDLEPNPERYVASVTISDCRIYDNTGYGVRLGGADIRGVRILDNNISDCGFGGVLVSEASDVELQRNLLDVVKNPVLIRRNARNVAIRATTCRPNQFVLVESGSEVTADAASCATSPARR